MPVKTKSRSVQTEEDIITNACVASFCPHPISGLSGSVLVGDKLIPYIYDRVKLYENGDFAICIRSITQQTFLEIISWINDNIMWGATFTPTLTMKSTLNKDHLNKEGEKPFYLASKVSTEIEESNKIESAFSYEAYYAIECANTPFDSIFKYSKLKHLGQIFADVCTYVYKKIGNITDIEPDRVKYILSLNFALLPKVKYHDLYKYMPVKELRDLQNLWLSERGLRKLQNYQGFCKDNIMRKIKRLQLYQKLLTDWYGGAWDVGCMKCLKNMVNENEERTVYNTPRIACSACRGRIHKCCQKEMRKMKEPQKCYFCQNVLSKVY